MLVWPGPRHNCVLTETRFRTLCLEGCKICWISQKKRKTVNLATPCHGFIDAPPRSGLVLLLLLLSSAAAAPPAGAAPSKRGGKSCINVGFNLNIIYTPGIFQHVWLPEFRGMKSVQLEISRNSFRKGPCNHLPCKGPFSMLQVGVWILVATCFTGFHSNWSESDLFYSISQETIHDYVVHVYEYIYIYVFFLYIISFILIIDSYIHHYPSHLGWLKPYE